MGIADFKESGRETLDPHFGWHVAISERIEEIDDIQKFQTLAKQIKDAEAMLNKLKRDLTKAKNAVTKYEKIQNDTQELR